MLSNSLPSLSRCHSPIYILALTQTLTHSNPNSNPSLSLVQLVLRKSFVSILNSSHRHPTHCPLQLQGDFQLLCRDGGCADVDKFEECNLATVPAQTLVAMPNLAEKEAVQEAIISACELAQHVTSARESSAHCTTKQRSTLCRHQLEIPGTVAVLLSIPSLALALTCMQPSIRDTQHCCRIASLTSAGPDVHAAQTNEAFLRAAKELLGQQNFIFSEATTALADQDASFDEFYTTAAKNAVEASVNMKSM
jgi:hypothetical protein